jgi:uracil-DNA glycosylase family 4
MNWEILNQEIISCRACPRLVAWREHIAETKRKAYLDWTYWGKPVSGFGDHDAEILVLGLAPGAHGSNRTGRMFTGDASGNFLFPALFRAGFCNQPDSESRGDGLKLNNLFITAVCRCAPPQNKPLREEKNRCLSFLKDEIKLIGNLKGVVALGQIAFNTGINVLRDLFNQDIQNKPKFTHGLFIQKTPHDIWLLSSYHPSRQNTQTGRLTRDMFDEIWLKANELLISK